MSSSNNRLRINHEDYQNPADLYPNQVLVFLDDTEELSKDDQKKSRKLARGRPCLDEVRDKELCWSCGWTVSDEMLSSYGSRIRIIQALGNVGLWKVGSRWIIRDQPNDSTLGNDFITQNFLRSHADLQVIPLIQEMRLLSAPTDPVCLTLMSQLRGVDLHTVWESLSLEEQDSLRQQLKNAMKSWRQFTSVDARKVDGSLLYDSFLAMCKRRRAPACKKLGRTNDEWFQIMEKELRLGIAFDNKTEDPVLIEAKFQELKANFPKSEPYVLTHGDLNPSNLMVRNGKLEAIIDWEFSGYMPWWIERYMTEINAWGPTPQLFQPIWSEIDGLDDQEFYDQVFQPVRAVARAYSTHPNENSRWLRGPFCDCQPWAGSFKLTEMGWPAEHTWKE
ncbi:kinase-like domain-containing protein [Rhexocercosporidium sp. MPI-PUGE-AT-0058]|nr:kinase-like domain-containing protein [Rhexocercosporidium sp. MPI-PUGE-AT-0058]